MSPIPIERGPRQGAWELEGGYRNRTELALKLLTDRLTQVHLEFETLVAAPPCSPLPPGSLERLHEVQLLADATVLISVMAVESFLNYYGVVRLGQEFYQRHVERLGMVQELASLMAICTGQLLVKDDEILGVTESIFNARNALRTRRPGSLQRLHLPS